MANYISLCIICKEAPPRTELGESKDDRENVLCFYFSIVPAVPGKFQGLVLHNKQNDSALEANKLPAGEWSYSTNRLPRCAEF